MLTGPCYASRIVEARDVDDDPVQVVAGFLRDGDRVLRIRASNAAATIAAVALLLRDLTGRRPQIYLPWPDRHPLTEFAGFVFFGVGEVALRTRMILHRAEPDAVRRPTVHVGRASSGGPEVGRCAAPPA
jgi:hypothetical protein